MSLKKSPDGNYVIMKMIGNIDRVIAMKNNIKAHKYASKYGINCFLLDLTECRNNESIIDNHKFAYKDMNVPDINKLARIAMLVDPEDHSHDFIEVVTRNSGLNVKKFISLEEAVRFLSESIK